MKPLIIASGTLLCVTLVAFSYFKLRSPANRSKDLQRLTKPARSAYGSVANAMDNLIHTEKPNVPDYPPSEPAAQA